VVRDLRMSRLASSPLSVLRTARMRTLASRFASLRAASLPGGLLASGRERAAWLCYEPRPTLLPVTMAVLSVKEAVVSGRETKSCDQMKDMV